MHATNTELAKTRAVLYLRQSISRDDSISIEMQEDAGRDYCARMGYTVIDVKSDPGLSGRRWDNRPAVQEVMDLIESKHADVVVLWKWSRLTRSRLHFALAAERIETAGGRIESATEPLDTTTASGRFARGMMTEYAAFQSEQIGEQWREVREHRRRQGLPPTGGARFGYVRTDDVYTPDPEVGPILADLYRRYLGGAGAAQLTRHLNGLGVTTSGGRRWTYQALMSMLDSGFAAGLIGRARAARRVWEREYTPGAHEPLITAETWEAYMAARVARHKQPSRESDKYLLTGLLRCGDCGSRMHGHQYPTGPTYVCSRATSTDSHRKVSIIGWRAERAVEVWLFELATDVDARAVAKDATRHRSQKVGNRRQALGRDLEKANTRLTALTVKLADGTITDAAYSLASAQIETERVAAERQLQMLADNPVQKVAAASLPADLVALWSLWGNGQKQAVLRPLIDHIVVAPASHRGARFEDRVRVVGTWAEHDG